MVQVSLASPTIALLVILLQPISMRAQVVATVGAAPVTREDVGCKASSKCVDIGQRVSRRIVQLVIDDAVLQAGAGPCLEWMLTITCALAAATGRQASIERKR